ncbi:MAG: alpha-1,4-glucan--maltose-1-phosphate maltosyltransferase [Porticoccaceae bacterium]
MARSLESYAEIPHASDNVALLALHLIAARNGFKRVLNSTGKHEFMPRTKNVKRLRPDKRIVDATSAPRIVLDRIRPSVDANQFPAKATVGQDLVITADVFMDGHDQLAAEVVWQEPHGAARRIEMRELGNDRWQATVRPNLTGCHRFTIEAWHDRWGTFRNELHQKYLAGLDVALEIEEGKRYIRGVAAIPDCPGSAAVQALAAALAEAPATQALELMLADSSAVVLSEARQRAFLVRGEPEVSVQVERLAAGFASWYELFPRSQTDSPERHGTFDDVVARLPAIRAMGFDVLYFPPIHPIGETHRKGRNNSLRAAPGEPGSPYAIGAADGGHDAVHADLGGLDALRRLHRAAEAQGIELALDFAIQCSPDHPWLKEHPGWFSWRSDGSIRYAENPPKKYEDIVNVDFYAEDAMPALWLALRDVVQFWVNEGIKIFRVDNPHTKPLPFWQWLIADIRERDPDVIFLAEAFTRPAMMYRLGKIGFTQSYTYFTWRHGKQEFIDYLHQLVEGDARDYYRPHFFVNTPDINPPFLQTSGRAGFLIRAALATTLSGLWGMYSGFELCDAAPLPGREEYLDSEKYQIRPRPLSSFAPTADNIIAEISQLNRIRSDNLALQTHLGISFYPIANDQILYFAKATADRSSFVLVAISLDPHNPQSAHFDVPMAALGFAETAAIEVTELMSGAQFTWYGRTQHWYFDPQHLPFAIWRLAPIGA